MKQKKRKDRFNGYISFHTISYVYICEIILGQKKYSHAWSIKQTIVSPPCQCHSNLLSLDTLTSHRLLGLSSYLYHYGLNQHQRFWKLYNYIGTDSRSPERSGLRKNYETKNNAR